MKQKRKLLSSLTVGGKPPRGFTLVELLVVLVISSIVISGIFTFIGKQRRQTSALKLKANLESLTQLTFFVMGRDIRRAGSNPKGWDEFIPGEAIAFETAAQHMLVIRSDLDGDGLVGSLPEEIVTYRYVDSDDTDLEKDQIERIEGTSTDPQLVIQNVREFEFCYDTTSNLCVPNEADTPTIRAVKMRIVAGTGRINPDTGIEDTKEIQMTVRPRNFDL